MYNDFVFKFAVARVSCQLLRHDCRWLYSPYFSLDRTTAHHNFSCSAHYYQLKVGSFKLIIWPEAAPSTPVFLLLSMSFGIPSVCVAPRDTSQMFSKFYKSAALQTAYNIHLSATFAFQPKPQQLNSWNNLNSAKLFIYFVYLLIIYLNWF